MHGADSLKHVGHVLLELSVIINCFLQTHPNNFIIAEITGPRRQENGLVVPGKFTAFTKSVAIGQKLKEQKSHAQELCKHMEIEITESEKKLFSSSDAAVAEA